MALGPTPLALSTLLLAAMPAFPQRFPLASGTLAALRAGEGLRAQACLEHLMGLRASLGLDDLTTFTAGRAVTDRFGLTHVAFQQRFQGVPVFEGAAVAHLEPDGRLGRITDALARNLALDVQPYLTPAEARAIAHGAFHPNGPYARPPSADLVVYQVRGYAPRPGLARARNAEDFDRVVLRSVLAYHVHASLRNPGETREADAMLDARTGEVLRTWDDLHTAASSGTGQTQYSGTLPVSTSTGGAGFSLTDALRGGTTVNDMANGTGAGTLYTNATDAWGDGRNYFDDGSSGATQGPTGQTTAIDALSGFQMTWDFYRNVLGRDGIDGTGTATALNVHYDQNYDNAYWDDTCFCMTFGDGSAPASGGFNNLTAPDVIGHELSHGVCANNGLGGLTYSGESGGLNEADSDIQGTFVAHYGYNGGTGSTVPDTIPEAGRHGYVPWTIGSQFSRPPLRYMYKPSLDGASADAWSDTLGDLDVHHSSGPANRAVFFLAQGAGASGDASSTYLPRGMAGIGNDHAARIWYRALTTYFTPGETYAQARAACMSAAADLYGDASLEYRAVQNAFAGINVGSPAGDAQAR